MNPSENAAVSISHEHPGQDIPAPVVQAAPEDAKPVEQKLSKQQAKQLQKYIDRVRRHMGRGLTEDQARMLIAKEDYDNLSPEKKIKRLEGIVIGSVQGVRQDILNLKHNDSELADAMDINFRAFSKMLLKAGISLAEQNVFMAEAQAEVASEQERKAAKKLRQAEEAKAKAQDKTVKEEAAEPDASGPTAVPEAATEFKG